MTIVSQTIIDDYTTGQGQRKISMVFTDNVGKKLNIIPTVPIDTDADAFLIAYIPKAEEKFIQIELREVAGAIDSGEIVPTRNHSTEAEFDAVVTKSVENIETRIAKDQLIVDGNKLTVKVT